MAIWIAISVALDLLENPNEWWTVLRQRLAEKDAARSSQIDTAA
jgi:hypothetical protein